MFIRKFGFIILLCTLLGSFAQSTFAVSQSQLRMAYDTTSSQQTTADDVLKKAAAELTEDDLRLFVELALTESITVDEAAQFIEKLADDQQELLYKLLDEKAVVRQDTPAELEQGLRNDQILRDQAAQQNTPQATAACDPAAQQQGFCWLQPIEYFYGASSYEGRAPTWHQRYTTICDNDPGDTDLVLYFNIDSSNPDSFRWLTFSAAVYAASFGGSQNGFDFDNWGAHLCMANRISAITGYTDVEISDSIMLIRVIN